MAERSYTHDIRHGVSPHKRQDLNFNLGQAWEIYGKIEGRKMHDILKDWGKRQIGKACWVGVRISGGFHMLARKINGKLLQE